MRTLKRPVRLMGASTSDSTRLRKASELLAGSCRGRVDLVIGRGAEDAGEHVCGEKHERDDAEDGDPGGDGDDEEESADHESLKMQADIAARYAMQP